MTYLDDFLASVNHDMADALEDEAAVLAARFKAAVLAEIDNTPQTPGPADAANCPSAGPGVNPDPSPGGGAPVSPPERGVGPSLQVGTAWCGIADVRRAARG